MMSYLITLNAEQQGENIPLHIIFGLILLLCFLSFIVYLFIIFSERPRFPLSFDVSSYRVSRGKAITIQIKLDEAKVEVNDFILEMQCKDPARGARWHSDYLSQIIRDDENNGWKAEFSPPEDAVPGLYDFRVRFQVPEGRNGAWDYAWDLVEIRDD